MENKKNVRGIEIERKLVIKNYNENEKIDSISLDNIDTVEIYDTDGCLHKIDCKGFDALLFFNNSTDFMKMNPTYLEFGKILKEFKF